MQAKANLLSILFQKNRSEVMAPLQVRPFRCIVTNAFSSPTMLKNYSRFNYLAYENLNGA